VTPTTDTNKPGRRCTQVDAGNAPCQAMDAAASAQQLRSVFETRAIPTARPTRGSADLIITAYRAGRTVTIVSNNSSAAIAGVRCGTGQR
jgi:hypothetical protein